MRTPLLAMIWELWRTSSGEILLRVAWTIGLVLLMCSSPFAKQLSEAENHVVCGVVLMILTIISLSSSSWWLQFDREHAGVGFRLAFTRPVSTAMIVLVPMLYTMVVSVICFTVPAMLFGRLRGVPMPVVGPALFVACAVTCFMAAAWSPATMFRRFAAIGAAIAGLGAAVPVLSLEQSDPDPILMAIGKQSFYDFAWYHYAVLLAVSLCAMTITVACVDRQRHGDHLRSTRPPRSTMNTSAASFKSLRTFRSPFAAQCWYEFRRFGTTILLIAAVATAIVFGCIAVQRIDPPTEKAPLVWLVALGLCPFAYQIVGIDGAIGLRRKQGAVKYSAFDGTRGMTNDRLIACKLVVIAVCSLAGWLLMGLVACLDTALFGDWDAWRRIGETVSQHVGEVSIWWWVAGVSNCVLLYLSSCSILLAFGLWVPLYSRWVFGAAVVFYCHFLLAAWDMTHQWRLRPLWTAYGYLLAIAVFVVCIVALKRALSAGFLGKRLFFAALCLWAIYVASTVSLYVKVAPTIAIPTAAIALGGSLLLVPLAATAFAPLALASHRHG